jgi:hypothetical protein
MDDPEHADTKRASDLGRWEAWALGANVVGVVVVAASAAIAGWTALIMRDQQRVMESQQRPWVSVAMEAGPSNLHFESDGSLRVPVTLRLKNLGDGVAMAMRVATKAFSYAPSVSTPGDYLLGRILVVQQELCDPMRTEVNRYSQGPSPDRFVAEPGFTLFPQGERVEFQDAQILKDDLIFRAYSGTRVFIVGCADYKFYISPQHHQTRFAYELTIMEPAENFPSRRTETLVTADAEVTPGEINLQATPTGNGLAD